MQPNPSTHDIYPGTPANQPSHKHLYHNLYSSPSKSEANTLTHHTIGSNSGEVATNRPSIDNDNSINTDIFSSPTRQNRAVRKPKICKVCSKPIIGTLVRAMGNIYHVNCFTCYDCHKPCSDKFFAADIEVPDTSDPNLKTTINVPLCEYHYFKRIDLICYNCNHAIRGSYITALGRKYHSEHFFCEICHKVFESDNYYANDGKIYCHFHYSKLYAYHCESCKCAILKQYVEVYRGGKQQQWHPECFMVHKFWNVDVTVNSLGLGLSSLDEVSSNPDKLYKVETSLEKLTISIWLTLSEFEESCASLISDMLHTATINNKSKGLSITSKLVFKIRCLFKSIDLLSNFSNLNHLFIDYSIPKYQNYSKLIKEPRSLTSNIMSYLTFLRDINSEQLTINKYSHELLSLISTIAHFIKLISRNALMYALEFNKLSNSTKPTELLLNEISNHENYSRECLKSKPVSSKSSDECASCNKSIEDRCILYKINDSIEKRWHLTCFHCTKCPNNPQILVSDLSDCAYNLETNDILCPSCASSDVNSKPGFILVSKFMQLTYLLEIAIIRSRIVVNKREKRSHIKQSSDVSISPSVASSIPKPRRISLPNDNENQLHNDKICNNANTDQKDNLTQTDRNISQSLSTDSYETKVTEITRRRSLREARQLNNANREIRKSVILEAPVAWSADREEITEPSNSSNGSYSKKVIGNNEINNENDNPLNSSFQSSNRRNNKSNHNRTIGTRGSMKLRVKEVSKNTVNSKNFKRSNSEKSQTSNLNSMSGSLKEYNGSLNAALTSKLLKNESSLTLDDIPRIVSSEQAREHRPNAFRFQRRDYSSTISTLPTTKDVNSTLNSNSNNNNTKSNNNDNSNTIKNIKNNINSDKVEDSNRNKTRNDNKNNTKNIASLSASTGLSNNNTNSHHHHHQHHNHQHNSTNSYTSNKNKEGIKSLLTPDLKSKPSVGGKRYSELDNISHEYIRHIAAFALYDLFSNKMTLDECVGLIDIYKAQSFWEKLFGSGHNNGSDNLASNGNSLNNSNEFKSGSATISGTGKGVFGVPLTTLVSRYGADSDLGVGSHKVRIPFLIDELINVMRTQDVSTEGVFRLNGNIKRLRQLVEAIDSHPEKVPKLETETPIQLAALLKKFLRDLPIPLLTFKLYDLFLLSQRYGSSDPNDVNDIKLANQRERILKLAYAMLPKPHRDLTEVLFAFLSWVSTFANADNTDDSLGGSKMDTHNLATVIAPNILYTKIMIGNSDKKSGNAETSPPDTLTLLNSVGGENQFLAIEVINEMIEMNDELSIIPEDLLDIFKLSRFDAKSNDKEREKEKDKNKNSLLTKDIMAKLKNVVESNPGVLSKF